MPTQIFQSGGERESPLLGERVWVREVVAQLFVAGIILDRNSPVRFHQRMVVKAAAKTIVHGGVNARRVMFS